MRIFLERICFVFLSVLLISSAALAQENKILLNEKNSTLVYKAQEYLSQLKTAKAQFLQYNPDGLPISEGEFYISKPGKLMIKYIRPFNLFYYIKDENFIQYDYDLDQVTRATAPANPLRVLLYDDIKFYDNKIMDVAGVKSEGDSFSIFLASKVEDYEEISGLILSFSKKPMKLIAIKRVDNIGNYTSMELKQLEVNVELDEEVFNFVRPKAKYPSIR